MSALYGSFIEWKQGIADWIDTTSGPTYDNTGTFIRLAELELDKRLRLREAMRFAKTVIDNDGIITLPDDYAQLKQVMVGPQEVPLEALTPDQYQKQRARSYNRVGQPGYYTIIGNNLQFLPLGVDLTVEIGYYRKAEPLSDTVPENIYTIYAAEVLLTGAVMYGFKFSNDEERLALWQVNFEQLITASNADAQRGELPTSPLRMRPNTRFPNHRSGVL